MRENVADGVDGNAELGRTVQETRVGLFGLVSFTLVENVSCIEDRNRSARFRACRPFLREAEITGALIRLGPAAADEEPMLPFRIL